jgi:formate dehydrogenase subunit delta
MDVNNLIHMANRIGEFYQSYSDKAEAHEGIVNHIAKFWEPRMRRALLGELRSDLAKTMMPLVHDAVLANEARLMPSA